MKKKILVLCLVVAMLATAVVSGSLAWFTDNDEVTNTFTIGSIEIEQHEKDNNGNDFVQDQQLLPVVNVENPKDDPNYKAKVVTVENTGKNDAYIRTFIASPKTMDGKLVLDYADDMGTWVEKIYCPDITIDGIVYKVECYVYTLASKATTPVLLEGVYLDASVDVQENPNANNRMEFCWKGEDGEWVFSGFAVEDATKINVLVATQAVQTAGFINRDVALESSFGSHMEAASLPFDVD